MAGGRNLGDEYFGASDEANFVDLDFAMVGPIVRDASMSFDRYRNSAAAYPIESLDPERVTPAALEEVRAWLVAQHRRETSASVPAGPGATRGSKPSVARNSPLHLGRATSISLPMTLQNSR